MKVSTTITAVFLVVALSLTTLGAYTFINTSTEVIENQVQNHLLTTAESRADHIETYFAQNIERLEFITSKTQLKIELKQYNEDKNQVSLNKITKIINDAKEPVKDFERICIIGLNGVVITSTNDAFCGKDVHNSDFFTQGKKKKGIYFIKENEQEIFVSGPFVLNGELLGVGITVIKLNGLHDIVKDRTGLKDTGEVLVAIQKDGQRKYLFERLFEEEALTQDAESEATAEPIKQALLKNEIVFENSLDYRNKEVIAVSQYIENAKMGLVAKIDREEAIGTVSNELIKDVSYIAILIFVIATFVGWLLGRHITKPLKKLSEDVDEITKGKIDIQLTNSNIAEIQSLTNSLNRILASLKLAILRTGASAGELGLGTLKKKVKEVSSKWDALNKNTDDNIFLIDEKGTINEANQISSGQSPEEIIGHTVYEYLSKDEKAKLKKTIETANKTGKPLEVELSVDISEKGKRWMNSKIIPIIAKEMKTEESEDSEKSKVEGPSKIKRIISKLHTKKEKWKSN